LVVLEAVEGNAFAVVGSSSAGVMADGLFVTYECHAKKRNQNAHSSQECACRRARFCWTPPAKSSGGALCARLSCEETALKKRRLEQECELAISEEDRPGLDAFVATLPQE